MPPYPPPLPQLVLYILSGVKEMSRSPHHCGSSGVVLQVTILPFLARTLPPCPGKQVLTSALPGRGHHRQRQWSQRGRHPAPGDCRYYQGVWQRSQVSVSRCSASGPLSLWCSSAFRLAQPLSPPSLRLETLYGTSIRKAELEARLQYLKVGLCLALPSPCPSGPFKGFRIFLSLY